MRGLGRVEEAKTQWKALIELDAMYQSADALNEEYRCAEAFLDEARKLVMRLSDES